MSDNILTQLTNLRQLFADAAPTEPKVINDYAWTVVKALLQHTSELNSLTSRQLLADCLKLPIERPSKLYSALLSAAVKVSTTYSDFRFAAFLKLWGIENLRPDDHERQHSTILASSSPQVSSSFASPSLQVSSSFAAGKSFHSLAEKTARTLAHSLLLHPEDRLSAHPTTIPTDSSVTVHSLLRSHSLSICPMLVTRIKEATGKDGRKFTFVTLTSPEGLEVETTSHSLKPSPLHPLPEGNRHYVNIGQLYDCLLRQKQATVPDGSPSGKKAAVPASSQATVPDGSQATVPDGPQATVPDGSPSGQSSLSLKEAYLSPQRPTEVFPTEIGYIESIDQQHGHMHIYDAHSRHFVANIQRFSKEKAGDFILFIPITPQESKFKTAIILATVPSHSSEVQTLLREIRITKINKEKGYAAWELTDKSHPITELLSPLQLSQGETSPTFTSGYLHLDDQSSSSLSSSLYKAFIYLKRGKDHNKRPHIARLF